MRDYGYIRAQEEYDRAEPSLPVCSICRHSSDVVAEVYGDLLCENCLKGWIETHTDIVADRILAEGFFI